MKNEDETLLAVRPTGIRGPRAVAAVPSDVLAAYRASLRHAVTRMSAAVSEAEMTAARRAAEAAMAAVRAVRPAWFSPATRGILWNEAAVSGCEGLTPAHAATVIPFRSRAPSLPAAPAPVRRKPGPDRAP